MKIKNQFISIILIIMLCATNQFANAQLGGILNKVKEKVKSNKSSIKYDANGNQLFKDVFVEEVMADCDNCPNNAIMSANPIRDTTLPETPVQYNFNNVNAQALYCRFIFDKPVKDFFKEHNIYWGSTKVTVEIAKMENNDKNGDAPNSENEKWDRAHKMEVTGYYNYEASATKKYLDVRLIPDAYHIYFDFSDDIISSAKNFEAFCNPGKHKYRIQIPTNTKKHYVDGESDRNTIACYGEFEYEMNGTITKTYINEQEAKFPVVRDSVNAARAKVPDEYYSSHGTFSDPQLSIPNLKSIFSKALGCKEIYTLTVQDGEGDYGIQYDKTMIPAQPLYKFTPRNIFVVFQSANGDCRYGRYYIKCGYLSGDGKYGSPYFVDAYGVPAKIIPCDKVKRQ